MRLRLGSMVALLLLAGLAAGFQLTGTQGAQAQCSVLSRHPCNPFGCSVFRRRPCFPQILPSIGQDLRLTIMSDKSGNPTDGRETAPGSATDTAPGTEHKLNTIRDMFDALRACWVPPAQ